MKTPVKILILFVAVVVAVGGVLLYMKIIMAPPIEMGTKNQYTEYLGSLTQNLKDSAVNDMEQRFQRFSDMNDRLTREELITVEEGQKSYNDFILVYAPKFSDWGINLFRQPEWNGSQLNWMVGRINDLNSIKTGRNESLIAKEAPDTKIEFDKIKNIVGKYHDAVALASSKYSSLADSKNKIDRSREFLNDEYLKNNTSLRSSLSALPQKLEAGHYASLRSQVGSLGNFERYSRNEYDKHSDKVVQSIKEYQANANSVYGRSSDINGLISQASTLMLKAQEFFELKDYNERFPSGDNYSGSNSSSQQVM